jgi:hypothetical protein
LRLPAIEPQATTQSDGERVVGACGVKRHLSVQMPVALLPSSLTTRIPVFTDWINN